MKVQCQNLKIRLLLTPPIIVCLSDSRSRDAILTVTLFLLPLWYPSPSPVDNGAVASGYLCKLCEPQAEGNFVHSRWASNKANHIGIQHLNSSFHSWTRIQTRSAHPETVTDRKDDRSSWSRAWTPTCGFEFTANFLLLLVTSGHFRTSSLVSSCSTTSGLFESPSRHYSSRCWAISFFYIMVLNPPSCEFRCLDACSEISRRLFQVLPLYNRIHFDDTPASNILNAEDNHDGFQTLRLM